MNLARTLLYAAERHPDAEAAGRAASDAIESPLEDIHGSAAYRRHLAGVLVARTARRAWERAVA